MSPAGAAGMYGRASTEGTSTVSVIVIEFITPDRIVADPDGSEGRPAGRAVLARYGRTAQ